MNDKLEESEGGIRGRTKHLLVSNFTWDEWVSNFGTFLALKTCPCPRFEVMKHDNGTVG
jgi:hypothetical protein